MSRGVGQAEGSSSECPGSGATLCAVVNPANTPTPAGCHSWTRAAPRTSRLRVAECLLRKLHLEINIALSRLLRCAALPTVSDDVRPTLYKRLENSSQKVSDLGEISNQHKAGRFASRAAILKEALPSHRVCVSDLWAPASQFHRNFGPKTPRGRVFFSGLANGLE